jgi:hypothetical protein
MTDVYTPPAKIPEDLGPDNLDDGQFPPEQQQPAAPLEQPQVQPQVAPIEQPTQQQPPVEQPTPTPAPTLQILGGK